MIYTIILLALKFLGGITREQWSNAIEAVRRADEILGPSPGDQKKTLVVNELRSLGVLAKNHVMNLLIETAVAWVKKHP